MMASAPVGRPTARLIARERSGGLVPGGGCAGGYASGFWGSFLFKKGAIGYLTIGLRNNEVEVLTDTLIYAKKHLQLVRKLHE